MTSTFGEAVMASLAKAQKDECLTDYVLVCEGQKLPVHKLIITVQSAVFRAACTGSFKEAKEGAYQIKDFSVSIVRHLIDYLYTGKYSVPLVLPGEKKEKRCGAASPLLDHVKIFALADKYAIDGLPAVASGMYRNALFSREFSDIEAFWLSVPEIYKSTPASVRGLRDVAVSFANCRLPQYRGPMAHKGAFKKVTADIPEFAEDLLDAFMFPKRQ